MRIADVAVATLFVGSLFSWTLNRTSTMLIFTFLGCFLGAWYLMLRLLGRLPNARERKVARGHWRGFLRWSLRSRARRVFRGSRRSRGDGEGPARD